MVILTSVAIGCIAGYAVIGAVISFFMYVATALVHKPDNADCCFDMKLLIPCLLGGILWPITIIGFCCFRCYDTYFFKIK